MSQKRREKVIRRLKRKIKANKIKSLSIKYVNISHYITASPLAKTGFSHSKCYAAHLESCVEKISREHYVSANILELFDYIEVKDIPFFKGKITKDRISPLSLNAKVLCEAHNTFLSDLDNMVGELFRFLMDLNVKDRRSIIINGYTLEKWMCKLLAGYISSGIVEFNGKKYAKSDIPVPVIEYIYLNKSMPDGWGLYSLYKAGDRLKMGKKIKFNLVFLEERIIGLNLNLSGLNLILSLESKGTFFKTNHPDYQNVIYRLKKLKIEKPAYTKLTILWENNKKIT